MPMPKKSTTRSKRGMRRAHHGVSPVTVVGCPNCGATVKPHHVCPSCGYYKGKSVIAAD